LRRLDPSPYDCVRRLTVPAKLKSGPAVLAAISVAYLLATSSASAISVEVAKKCDVLTEKAYPLRVPGNPAAGHKHGSAKEIQDYFNKCVDNDGNVAAPAPGQDNNKTPPGQGSGQGGQTPGGTK
jgi:hypothetical protein